MMDSQTNETTTIDPEGPLGEPCDRLTPERKVIWQKLAALTRPGVLVRRHRLFMEMAVTALDRVRRGDLDTPEGYEVVRRILSEFGFNKKTIAKLMGEQPKPRKKSATGWAGHTRPSARSKGRAK